MDKTVLILIGAGVCCAVMGTVLFIKLLSVNTKESEEMEAQKNLLDDEYLENFQECFENTGSIEDTLEQLSNIYIGNQYMYNLIINALDFIREEQGDYETALDKINVDNDINIMKIHNAAIKKALNISIPKVEPPVPVVINNDITSVDNVEIVEEEFEEDEKNLKNDSLNLYSTSPDVNDYEEDDLDDFKIG